MVVPVPLKPLWTGNLSAVATAGGPHPKFEAAGPFKFPVSGAPVPGIAVGVGEGLGAGSGASTASVEYHENKYVTPALNVISTGPDAKLYVPLRTDGPIRLTHPADEVGS